LIRALTGTWWLLTLCGVLDAMNAAMNLLMTDRDGSLALRGIAPLGAIWNISVLAVAAGACAIVAGLWNRGRENFWLLSLHGLALGVFGAIGLSSLVRGPLSFRPISLLFVAMSLSIGAFAFGYARTLRRGVPEKWLMEVAGAVFFGLAISFFAVGFGGVSLEPNFFWIWMSFSFAFRATFMLWLAVSVRGRNQIQAGQREAALLPGSPRHAH